MQRSWRGIFFGAKLWEEFSGQKAFEHVQRLVDFGPRPPASEAIEKSRAYIVKQLEQSGWTVTQQEFTDDTPRGKIRFVNLIANFRAGGRAKENATFLVCSHYDTKTFDSIQFVGANDGGSMNRCFNRTRSSARAAARVGDKNPARLF